MWNRRKEEEYAPKPVAAPPKPSEPIKEVTPTMSAMPSRTPAESFSETQRGGPAVLGKSVMVKGQIYSREDLTIDGEVEGTVECQEHRLTVGANGKVTASVKAREIVVLGTIHGNVETADKLEIRKDAKLVGDIKTARIVIEDGAYFKGNIDIARPEAARPQTAAAKPQTAPAPAASTPPAAPAQTVAAGAGEIKR